MEQGLSDLFNTPPEWAAFAKMGRDLGDGLWGIDLLPVMEAITPIFKTYRDMTYPRHFRRPAGHKGLSDAVDYFVIPRGLSRSGTMGYRVLRTGTHRRISVLDIDRVLDDAELYGRKTSRPAGFDIVRNLRDTLLDTQMETVHRKLQTQARWVHDLRFLIGVDAGYFQYMDDARGKTVEQMMHAIDEKSPLSDTQKIFVRGYLLDALVEHDVQTTALSNELLVQARERLNPDVVNILAQQPSTQTTKHYKFLAWNRNPSRMERRLDLVRKYPILLLINNFEQKISEADNQPPSAHLPISSIFSPLYNQKFLSELREHHIGARNAHDLRRLHDYWMLDYQPKTIEEWDNISALKAASHKIERHLGIEANGVFNDLVKAQAKGEGHLLDHLYDTNFADIRVRDTKDWMNYLASLVAIRVWTDAQQAGANIPFSHALYASGFDTPAVQQAVQSAHVTVRRQLKDQESMTHDILERVSVLDMMDYAYAYTNARKAEDAPLPDVLVSNRLLEHGASYTWGALPDVYIEDESAYVTAITSQDALLKNALRYNHDLWKSAVGAITGKSHFLDITGERGSLATAHVREPDQAGEAWDIVDVAPHARGRGHNAVLSVVEQYLQHPDFIAGYNPKDLQKARDGLVLRLGAQAKSNEYLGINHKNHAERVEYLRAFERFLPDIEGGFGMTASGAISSPAIDAMVANLIERIAPYYKPKGQNTAYKIG